MIKLATLSVSELASHVARALQAQAIDAVLVGGACVSIYTENLYESYDLDFVSHQPHRQLAAALEKIGFRAKGKYYVHPDTPYFIDFVAPPVAIGRQSVDSFAEVKTRYGVLKLLNATDCVKDRLASFFYWNDIEALEQARLVASSQLIDFSELERWASDEFQLEKYLAIVDSLSSR